MVVQGQLCRGSGKGSGRGGRSRGRGSSGKHPGLVGSGPLGSRPHGPTSKGTGVLMGPSWAMPCSASQIGVWPPPAANMLQAGSGAKPEMRDAPDTVPALERRWGPPGMGRG